MRLRSLLPLLLVSCNGDKGGFQVYNTPPGVSITQPPGGEEYVEGDVITFSALVDDNQQSPETLALVWSSDIDGELSQTSADSNGIATFVTANLSPGNHVITLQATDEDATSATDWVEVSVVDLADNPEIEVRSPQENDEGVEGEPFEFEVVVSDKQDDPAELLVVISSDVDGELCAGNADEAGVFTCEATLSAGAHSLTFEAIDTEDNVGAATDEFYVQTLSELDEDNDGYAASEGDCDDTNNQVHPGATEFYNSADDDCDGTIDEGTVGYDDDADGQTELEGDCNDALGSVYEGADEVCDSVDNDCDGETDEGTFCEDDDGDGYAENTGDCDDADAATYPGAGETLDAADNDCDGVIDETTAVYDDDGDCFCESGSCTGSIDPACVTVTDGDCDDGDSSVYPAADELCNGMDDDCDGTTDENPVGGTTYYDDDDGDSYGDAADSLAACSLPAGYAANDDDCDDADSAVKPGAAEVCDETDNDCDGTEDEGVTTTFYADSDSDTYGDPGVTAQACSVPFGHVANDDDCDDSLSGTYPGASEYCDSIDNDCDGTVDDGAAADAPTWYRDSDGDSYGSSSSTTKSCSAPAGYVSNSTDCNDGSASAYPGATEYCDSIDNDCDSTTDESDAADASTWYRDADSDGYGGSSTAKSCSLPAGYVSTSTDCNDSNSSVHPYATETCNSTDDDCDSSTDEGVTTTYYRDADSDGYGTSATTTSGCSAPAGYVSNSTDCNDSDATLNPNTTWYVDSDSDGYGGTSTLKQCTKPSGYVATSTDCNDGTNKAYPGATESCDGIDNDCDSSTDEQNASGCTTYYYDYDGDGYGSSSVSSRCYCSATGYYNVTNKNDCYDSNASANPAQAGYFTSSRGDGSYDYNCDGSQSKQYTDSGGCSGWPVCGYTPGWNSSNPSCGNSGTWLDDCDIDWTSCSKDTSSRTQSCK